LIDLAWNDPQAEYRKLHKNKREKQSSLQRNTFFPVLRVFARAHFRPIHA